MNEDLIGPITSVVSSMKEYRSKPVLSCAIIDETRVKISSRKVNTLKKTIKLDKVLVEAINTLKLDTEVGGHSSAAGAIVNGNYLVNFVDTVNEIILEVENSGS